MWSKTCWNVRTAGFNLYVYLSSGQSCAMVTRRLPTSFQFSRMAWAGVGGVLGCAPSWACVVPAEARSSAGTASRQSDRARFFIGDLLLGFVDCPAVRPR